MKTFWLLLLIFNMCSAVTHLLAFELTDRWSHVGVALVNVGLAAMCANLMDRRERG